MKTSTVERGDLQSKASAPSDFPILEIEGLRQRLWDPERREEFVVHIEPRVTITAGSFVSLLGPSGCGKTTLLTVLGLLRKISDPQHLARFTMHAWEDGKPVEHDIKALWLKNQNRTIEMLRRRHIGFSLQSGELLPALTVRENIAAPLRLNGVSSRECRSRVDQLIRAFGLDRERGPRSKGDSEESLPAGTAAPSGGAGIDSALAKSRVNKLSGGEYQRVALARSIAHWPALVFVDEPTASLNRDRAREALQQLQALRSDGDRQSTIIMITHDEELALEFSHLIIRMEPVHDRAAGQFKDMVVNVPTRTCPPEAARVRKGER